MIREIEEKYRSILNNIEELYYEVDLAGNLTISNDSMSKILGYSKDELIGMNNRQYMDGETSKKVYRMFNQVYRTGTPARAFDWELITKDGTRRILETSISLMYDSERRPRGFYGIGRDITDRKKAEEALRTEKLKFQILSENAPFAMAMIDRDGTFRYINPKFKELFGYDLTDVPDGKTWFKKAYPDSLYRREVISVWKEDLKSFKPGEKRPRVSKVTCKDGTEKIINFIPVQLETGENLMACEDITERRKAEEQERNLQRAKDKVLNHLSHELRTPLSIIQGNIRILKRKVLAQKSSLIKEEIFEMIERNLTRISDIQQETNEIIQSNQGLDVRPSPEALGLKESLARETIALHPFIEQILNKVKQNATHRDLHIQLDGTNNLSLNMDARVLGDILTGLLRNSIENTPDGGLIRVILDQKGHWTQLKVQDFGIGITKENQRHLFDGLFYMQDTELYASKKSYDFMAGGKGLDLLKIKVYSRRLGFDISVGSQRCQHLPKERDLCPGKIALCKYCKKPEDCLSSGGSIFCLAFPCPDVAPVLENQ